MPSVATDFARSRGCRPRCSILILAAATFNRAGKTDIAELDQAHAFLAPLLGSAIAPTLFGIALLCCGINSTVTATLSGQIVMEGFIDIRLPAWARRLTTRALAIVPAAIVTIWYGEAGTAKLLILSQVVLALQLPFAMIPLLHFTSSKKWMGGYRNGWFLLIAALHFFFLTASDAIVRGAMGDRVVAVVVWKIIYVCARGLITGWLLASWVCLFRQCENARANQETWIRY